LNLTWREFTYWLAYLDMEPPDQAENYRAAMLLAQITNMSGRSLPDGKRVKPEDFLGKPRAGVQSQAEQKAFLQSFGSD
jgi:hypothetical protein